MRSLILTELTEAATGLNNLLANEQAISMIEKAIDVLASCFESGSRVWSAGNGGSMCDAMHFAEELSGRYREDRAALAAMTFSDPGFLTCASNDFGYEKVFERAVSAHCKKGDCLVLFSTSGSSPNIISAAIKARTIGTTVIGFTGKPGSELSQLCDISIETPAGSYADRVQELHIKIVHILIAGIERQLFT